MSRHEKCDRRRFSDDGWEYLWAYVPGAFEDMMAVVYD